MIYGFATHDRNLATAALLVYVTWRSRDVRRFRITPDVWERIERFSKASAKRSRTLAGWLESMKPRVLAGTLRPQAMAVGMKGEIPMLASGDGSFVSVATPEDQREFMTGVVERADQREVLKRLYGETAWVVLLVRDRLERERPLEAVASKLMEDD